MHGPAEAVLPCGARSDHDWDCETRSTARFWLCRSDNAPSRRCGCDINGRPCGVDRCSLLVKIPNRCLLCTRKHDLTTGTAVELAERPWGQQAIGPLQHCAAKVGYTLFDFDGDRAIARRDGDSTLETVGKPSPRLFTRSISARIVALRPEARVSRYRAAVRPGGTRQSPVEYSYPNVVPSGAGHSPSPPGLRYL